AGIGTARLDVLVLLEDCLRTSRAHILAHPETPIQGLPLKRLSAKLARRARHEPLAYIRGFSEFYGRQFKIDRRVLQPRPESETMIELLKTLRLPINPRIADVGAGSGALGITAMLEVPRAVTDLFEIDENALKVAELNVKKYRVSARCVFSDLLRASRDAYDVILANLPYVPSYHHVNEAAGHEPRLAIYGGGDGLEIYRRLFNQLAEHYSPPQFVLTESLPNQHARLADIAAGAGYRETARRDFIQVFEIPKILD
ncbi:MAG TPA: HemK/PrmC family methyltransferase, partial [Candidatus Nitrosopolaris sp.]|nr:HemK/PrmC family methyltransferase [Candidatus Nitrosopolaris sp.]